MADIASSDVTYVRQEGSQFACPSDPKQRAIFKISYGNGSLTYPSGGIPLLKGKLGCPDNIESFEFIDTGNANGFVYKYDYVNAKIRIYQSGSVTPSGTVSAPVFTGSALTAHDHSIPAGTDAGGGTTGTTSGGTPAGTNSSPTFTGAATTAAALAEVTAGSFAPAATNLYAKVVGW